MAAFERLTERLAGLASWLFFAVGGMLAWEVVMRYFFNAPTIWAEELSRFAQIWATWLAAAWLLRSRRLIAVGLVYRRLPLAGRRLASFFALAWIALFCALASWYGVLIVAESVALGRRTATMLDMPLWVTEIAVPVGTTLLLAQCLCEILRLARDPRATFEPAAEAG